ncbi:hypothetical protein QC589_18270 [Halomonas elongata]|uniref:hypothetical protein n=1 Tax=Halomonas elongata TaxID=2746 RepID=UPI00334FFB94
MLVRWVIRRVFRDVPTWIKVVGVVAILAYVGWYNFLRMPTGGSLVGHKYIERPIYSYWVNDNWGGNGGVTCCWSFSGDTAEVVWIYGRTVEEFERGDEQERHSVTLPMPKRTREDRYLHVYFLPDNRVELEWSPSLGSPLEGELEQEYSQDD